MFIEFHNLTINENSCCTVRCLLIGWLCRWSCLNGCCWCVMSFGAAKSGCWLVDCALCRWSCWRVAADRLIVQVVPLKSGCWLVNCAGGVTEWWSLIGWLCRWCCWRVDADWLIVQVVLMSSGRWLVDCAGGIAEGRLPGADASPISAHIQLRNKKLC